MTRGDSGLLSQDKEDVAHSGNSTKNNTEKPVGELGKWEISLNVFQLWHATARNALVKSLSRLYL